MSRRLLNIILSVVALVLIVLIVISIKGPIDKLDKIDKVEGMVIAKLEDIKKAQMAYKEMNDTFASNFDDLIAGIKTGKIKKLRKLGDKFSDTLQNVKVDTVYLDAFEETFGKDYAIDLLGKVPPSNTYDFTLETNILDKSGIKVPVFQVSDPKPINPKRTLKLGSLSDAIYTGNWK